MSNPVEPPDKKPPQNKPSMDRLATKPFERNLALTKLGFGAGTLHAPMIENAASRLATCAASSATIMRISSRFISTQQPLR